MSALDECIGHAELVGGGVTTLHSHPGGGANVKSGTISGASGSVSFNTAFSSVPQVVITSLGNTATRDAIFRVDSVTVNGFSWTADTSQGGGWIATDAGNP